MEMVLPSGDWKWELIKDMLPPPVVSCIASYKPLFVMQLDSGYVAVEGVVRGKHGDWIIGYHRLEVVKAILGSTSTVSNSVLIRRIQNILALENQWFLWYIPKEQNQVADCLDKQALTGKDEL
ncbi:hypothetical protein Gohar_027307 [Gossypium harknessii]|uniref:RNase H type-1 domain-containing protein n=1 Tax=Gossypium harknessii TaxID=34285 RepID=A0A7J9HUC8_9ROSI|nr:hypothetical protein [Gossypium harknessii]